MDHKYINNLKCFVNWTVTSYEFWQYLAVFTISPYLTINRDCFSQKTLS